MCDCEIKIIGINWHNIYLHVKLQGNDLEKRQFAIASDLDRYVYPVDAFDPSTNELVLNITNLGHQKMLENGVWYIKYKNDDYQAQWDEYEKACDAASDAGEEKPAPPTEWLHIPITFEVGYSLKDMDKVYRYSGTNYAYLFTFAAVGKKEELGCSFTCTYMVKTNHPRKRYFHIASPHFRARQTQRLLWFLACVVDGI